MVRKIENYSQFAWSFSSWAARAPGQNTQTWNSVSHASAILKRADALQPLPWWCLVFQVPLRPENNQSKNYGGLVDIMSWNLKIERSRVKEILFKNWNDIPAYPSGFLKITTPGLSFSNLAVIFFVTPFYYYWNKNTWNAGGYLKCFSFLVRKERYNSRAKASLRKQPTFGDASAGFHAKWKMKWNETSARLNRGQFCLLPHLWPQFSSRTNGSLTTNDRHNQKMACHGCYQNLTIREVSVVL